MLKQAREDAGLTQEQLAQKLRTQKTAISRIENHAEDIKLSTFELSGSAVGLTVSLLLLGLAVWPAKGPAFCRLSPVPLAQPLKAGEESKGG